jgi:RNA polymerase sigma-70 factor (ECF subfamily)
MRVAAHRFRRRFADLLREEIADTVATTDDVEDELRALFHAVASD